MTYRKGLPCQYCGRPITGRSLVNLNMLKGYKHIRCPNCATLNRLTRHDCLRFINMTCWLNSTIKREVQHGRRPAKV